MFEGGHFALTGWTIVNNDLFIYELVRNKINATFCGILS